MRGKTGENNQRNRARESSNVSFCYPLAPRGARTLPRTVCMSYGAGFPDTLDELAEGLIEGAFEPSLDPQRPPAGSLAMRFAKEPPPPPHSYERTPRPAASAMPGPAARRARTEGASPPPGRAALVSAAVAADGTDEDPALVLSSMPSDALDKIVARLDSPDMVSLCCTCKATQRAVSAEWLWRVALARDFPAHCVHGVCLDPCLHPQRTYAATFSQIVDSTREKTRARFEPEKIQANTFIFALPALGAAASNDPEENNTVVIPQAVSHIALAKAIESITAHIHRTLAKSFDLGFLAHGLATLEGIR
jgi:hypothetical protein